MAGIKPEQLLTVREYARKLNRMVQIAEELRDMKTLSPANAFLGAEIQVGKYKNSIASFSAFHQFMGQIRDVRHEVTIFPILQLPLGTAPVHPHWSEFIRLTSSTVPDYEATKIARILVHPVSIVGDADDEEGNRTEHLTTVIIDRKFKTALVVDSMGGAE